MDKIEIYQDGMCPLCQAIRARVEQFDKMDRLKFLDYNDPAVAARAPVPRERLDEQMHVQAPDGTWYVGYFGWVVVLRALPRLSWLGWTLGAFPFRLIGPGVYRWIARHRYRIPGFPAPCHTDSCARPVAGSSHPQQAMRPHLKRF